MRMQGIERLFAASYKLLRKASRQKKRAQKPKVICFVQKRRETSHFFESGRFYLRSHR